MFVGRNKEIQQLKQIKEQSKSSFIVMQGRRRIGKSRLVKEFGKQKNLYTFIGLAPTPQINAQDQRDDFCRRMCDQLTLPRFSMDNWGDIFEFLGKQLVQQSCIIFLDEISWMAHKDTTFLSHLKNTWDLIFSQNTQLMLIVCGSISAWIEENIISNTLFLGRPTHYMRIAELPIAACHAFWGKQDKQISAFEKLKMLSVTGGVPRYLEAIDPRLSAEENIKQLCFHSNGFLFHEFETIFADSFGKKIDTYKAIVETLVNGALTQEEIFKQLNKSKTGDVSKYLNELILAGFIQRDYTWKIATENPSKLSRYRLKDNYVRFYLKHIYPNRFSIEKNLFSDQSIHSLPGYDGIMALQFENLVINNSQILLSALNIKTDVVMFINPYFQRETNKQSACQIDLLIQTKANSLYLLEIKFSKHTIKKSIIKEMERKISALALKKSFSIRPVLIHVNGVDQSIMDSGYFTHVIDFGEVLNGEVFNTSI